MGIQFVWRSQPNANLDRGFESEPMLTLVLLLPTSGIVSIFMHIISIFVI